METQKSTVWQKIANLPWFVWVIALGVPFAVGTDYFFSKWDGDALHPLWIRIPIATTGGLIFGAIIYGALVSSGLINKKKIQREKEKTLRELNDKYGKKL